MVRIRSINFDWQIGLIGMSAIIGLSIAYNAAAALRMFVVIAASIATYFLVANLPDPVARRGHVRSPLSGLFIFFTTVIAVYFLLTNDWLRWIGKVPVLNQLLNVLAIWSLGLTGLGLNPNVMGAALAALLPLQVAALRRMQARRWISAASIGLSMLALLLTQARGAWVSLILVSAAGLLWRFITNRSTDQRQARWIWFAIVGVAGATAIGLLTFTPLGERLLGLGGDRLYIWQNSIDLISDYPLTGLGLAGFEMAYATYSLLTHVGHTMHAHNLWLDMWLNQGLIGVLALAGMILNAIWPKSSSAWRTPSLLMLGVILLHSIVDDPYYGYGGTALLILFIPLGLLARSDMAPPTALASRRSRFQPAFVVWGGGMMLLAADLLTPTGRAIAEANLGALDQTRAELSVYEWPTVPMQDVLRQPNAVDLTSAIQHYQNALALDPVNATANRRLGQIELAREQFAVACGRLTAAYQAAPQQRATRQLLGECDAITGQAEAAAAQWQTVDVRQNQLDIRRWWYEEYLNDQLRATQMQQAMTQLP